MIVGYFAYSGILEHLLRSDPFSPKNLKARKAHIKQMADIILSFVEQQGETG